VCDQRQFPALNRSALTHNELSGAGRENMRFGSPNTGKRVFERFTPDLSRFKAANAHACALQRVLIFGRAIRRHGGLTRENKFLKGVLWLLQLFVCHSAAFLSGGGADNIGQSNCRKSINVPLWLR